MEVDGGAAAVRVDVAGVALVVAGVALASSPKGGHVELGERVAAEVERGARRLGRILPGEGEALLGDVEGAELEAKVVFFFSGQAAEVGVARFDSISSFALSLLPDSHSLPAASSGP